MLDSSRPATLSAGMGAFVAVTTVSVLIVIGTVLCAIRYRRRMRLRGADMAEVIDSYIVTYYLVWMLNSEKNCLRYFQANMANIYCLLESSGHNIPNF